MPLQGIYTFFTELLGLVYSFHGYFIGSDPNIFNATPFPGSSLYILPASFPWLPFLSGILSCSPAFAYLPIPSLISHLR